MPTPRGVTQAREGENASALRNMMKRIRRERPLAPIVVVRTHECGSFHDFSTPEKARQRVRPRVPAALTRPELSLLGWPH